MRKNVLGIFVDITSRGEVLADIEECIRSKNRQKIIVTVNPEIVMLAQDDLEYQKAINNADLVVPDGVGVKWAIGASETISGKFLSKTLLELKKYKIFLLGGTKGTTDFLANKYNCEFDFGEKNIRAGERESKRVIDKINKYKPDILLVAYGSPWQEKWLWANKSKLNVKVMIGVGGALDMLAGRVHTAPEWISNLGFEWLWRLIHEPWRWKRQLRLLEYIRFILIH